MGTHTHTHTNGCQVKLADFGVALKLSDNKQGEADLVGSPYWMAPEIIEMTNGEGNEGLHWLGALSRQPGGSERWEART